MGRPCCLLCCCRCSLGSALSLPLALLVSLLRLVLLLPLLRLVLPLSVVCCPWRCVGCCCCFGCPPLLPGAWLLAVASAFSLGALFCSLPLAVWCLLCGARCVVFLCCPACAGVPGVPVGALLRWVSRRPPSSSRSSTSGVAAHYISSCFFLTKCPTRV